MQNAVKLGTGAHEQLVKPALQHKVAVHAASGRAPAAGLDGHQQDAPSLPLQGNQGIKVRPVGRAVRAGLHQQRAVNDLELLCETPQSTRLSTYTHCRISDHLSTLYV